MLWLWTIAAASDNIDPEVCDGVDNNRNGRIDDGAVCDGCAQFNVGNTSYLVCGEEFPTQAAAVSRCAGFGYHLVDLDGGATELASIVGELDLFRFYWSGLTDTTANSYTWTDGTSATNIPWGPGEPDDLDATQGCAWLFAESGASEHALYDTECVTFGAGAVCEIDAPIDICDTSTPEPIDTDDTAPPLGPPPAGHVICGCQSSGAPGWWSLGFLAVLLTRRR